VKNVLVTGGTGFIGRHLIDQLNKADVSIAVVSRSQEGYEDINGNTKYYRADLTEPESLKGICQGVDTIFHLAGYAHDVKKKKAGDRHLHKRVTVEGTQALLNQALTSGVETIVFVSSVKAMGEGSASCIDEAVLPEPGTDYGRARLQAEEILLEAGKRKNINVCCLRLPMVYGPGNKGNLPKMIKAINKRLFPPIPEFHNKRSMVHVDDVVQALLLAATRPEANGKVYIVTDNKEYSTRELYNMILLALGRKAPGWVVPEWLLWAGARAGDLSGKIVRKPFPLNTDSLIKLSESAVYSCEKIQRELGYKPEYSLSDVLPGMVEESLRVR